MNLNFNDLMDWSDGARRTLDREREKMMERVELIDGLAQAMQAVGKWEQQGAKQRVLRLVDAYKNEVSKRLKLAKPRKELSADADAIENFVPTISDL